MRSHGAWQMAATGLPAREGLHEIHRLLLDAQQIRIDLSARQDDGVIVGSVRLIEDAVHCNGLAPVLLVPPLDLAAL